MNKSDPNLTLDDVKDAYKKLQNQRRGTVYVAESPTRDTLFVDEHFEQPRPAAAPPAKGASAEVLVAESESSIETSPEPTKQARRSKRKKSGASGTGRRRKVSLLS